MAEIINSSKENNSQRRITVLISGSGTNLQALIDAAEGGAEGKLSNATITHVISDRKDAYGLKRAQAAGIPTSYHGILPYKKKFPDEDGSGKFEAARRAYDADLAALVLSGASSESKSSGDRPQQLPSLVVCAGFMRIVTTSFLDPLKSEGVPIINLHPSLHGDLVGAGCIERAWEEFLAGKRTSTGVMVHYVIAEVDMGEPIVQEPVDMRGCKSLEELQGRIHETEHVLIVEGARIVLDGAQGR